jgi:hypothetical protein
MIRVNLVIGGWLPMAVESQYPIKPVAPWKKIVPEPDAVWAQRKVVYATRFVARDARAIYAQERTAEVESLTEQLKEEVSQLGAILVDGTRVRIQRPF